MIKLTPQKIQILEGIQDSPVYVYFSREIREMCRRFISINYTPLSIHFALMANDNHQFLNIIKEENLGVFVNSLPHLDKVLSLGFPPDKIIYTASSLTDDTLHTIHSHGVTVNLDSLNQARRWMELFPGASCGLRCNIGSLVTPKETRCGYFLGPESRLGLTPDEILSLKGEKAVKGLHLYAGTDILDMDYFRDCYGVLKGFIGHFPELTYLDVGGGFGVPESVNESEFDFDEFGRILQEVFGIMRNRKGEIIKVILEPGRILGAQAGYFLCQAIDIKKAGEQPIIVCNGSSAQFSRPLLYPDSAFHPVVVLGKYGEAEEEEYSICGCSTYSRDFLARKIRLPRVCPGDTLLFGYAGSYCASSYTQFLGFPKPAEIFVDTEGEPL